MKWHFALSAVYMAVVAVYGDGDIVRFDLGSGTEEWTVALDTRLCDAAITREHMAIVVDEPPLVRIYSSETGVLVQELSSLEHEPIRVAFSPSCETLAVSSLDGPCACAV